MPDAEMRLRHDSIVGGTLQRSARVQGRRQPAEKGGLGGVNRAGGAGPRFTAKTLSATNKQHATAGGQADGSYTAISGRTRHHSGPSVRQIFEAFKFFHSRVVRLLNVARSFHVFREPLCFSTLPPIFSLSPPFLLLSFFLSFFFVIAIPYPNLANTPGSRRPEHRST